MPSHGCPGIHRSVASAVVEGSGNGATKGQASLNAQQDAEDKARAASRAEEKNQSCDAPCGAPWFRTRLDPARFDDAETLPGGQVRVKAYVRWHLDVKCELEQEPTLAKSEQATVERDAPNAPSDSPTA